MTDQTAAWLSGFVVGVFVGWVLNTAIATAAPFTPSLNRAYGVALRYWDGPPPNCTSIAMNIVSDDSIPGLWGEATVPSSPVPCELNISRTLAPRKAFRAACAVMVHEVGHLHGYQHDPNPRSVMHDPITFIPRMCLSG